MREVFMSSGLLVLQLLLCSFSTSFSTTSFSATSLNTSIGPSISTSISNLPTGFPTNIIVQAGLREEVARLWEGSPTFRAQCLKIGEHKMYRVAVVIEPSLSLTRSWRAQCVLRVYSSGFVTARVMVPLNRQLNELIPHEMEHVVEHIEGIDVKRELGKSGTGTYDTGRGQIETLRATRVGRQARQELEASRDAAVALLTRR
jgi:hypothetical protein